MTLPRKLPRKEDLLPKPPKAEAPPAMGDSSNVKEAKDAADVAKQNYLKLEQEVNAKLLQEGYKSFEEARAEIKKKREEVDKLLVAAQTETDALAKERLELEANKEKIINAFKKIKETEEMAKTELEQAKRLDQERRDTQNNHNAFIQDLQDLMEYHQTFIRPCRKALLSVSYLIYNWADSLQNARIDFETLYNQIGVYMKVIDKYIEKENKHVPKDIEELLGDKKKG